MQTTLQSIKDLVPRLLGDHDKALWTLPVTKDLIDAGLRRFHQELRSQGVRQLAYRYDFGTILAGVTQFYATYTGPSTPSNVLPVDLIVPVTMWEANVGTTTDDAYTRMRGPGRLPDREPTDTLGFWDWRGGQIWVCESTQRRRVRLDYFGSYSPITLLTDTVQTPDATDPVARFVAGEILRGNGNLQGAREQDELALRAIEEIARIDVRAQQSVPRRRQPRLGYYRYPTIR